MLKDRILIKTEEGEKEYYKLVQFTDKSTAKEFLIFTDLKNDVNGSLNIYSSILKRYKDNYLFIPITDDKDKDAIEKAIIKVKLEFEKLN